MNHPSVASIRVEYADGSVDDMKFIHQGVCPLFSWKRQLANGEVQTSVLTHQVLLPSFYFAR